jgi:hypothetical protein
VIQKMLLLVFMGMALLALLVAAVIPDIEVQDDQVIWQPDSLRTATATLTPTEGWYDDLPTPSYGTNTPTPDLTQTPTAFVPIPTRTPTLGITDILITLTAESER